VPGVPQPSISSSSSSQWSSTSSSSAQWSTQSNTMESQPISTNNPSTYQQPQTSEHIIESTKWSSTSTSQESEASSPAVSNNTIDQIDKTTNGLQGVDDIEPWKLALIIGGSVIGAGIIVLVLIVMLVPSIRSKIFVNDDSKKEPRRTSVELSQIVQAIERSNLNMLEQKIIDKLVS